MKLTTVMTTLMVAILTLGLTSIGYASSRYYPPERINCKLDSTEKLSCSCFNRHYLAEDATNANLEKDKYEIFHFISAAAYFTTNQDEVRVFFTYHNPQGKLVKLKTINNSIRPDFDNGNWKKLTDDVYTCDAAYMQCLVTNLPAFTSK